MENKPKKAPPTSIRLNTAIAEKVKQDAEAEKRSISAQIEWIIERYYEIKEKISTSR